MFCCLKSTYSKALESAKEDVETDIMEKPYNDRNIPPMTCTYEGSYIEDGKHFHTTTTLNFSKTIMNDNDNNNNFEKGTNFSPSMNGNGWNISGNGSDADGSFTISDGKLCVASGQAYWIEHSEGRKVLNMGSFQTPYFESFVGSWHASNGIKGTYTSFKKKGNDVEMKK